MIFEGSIKNADNVKKCLVCFWKWRQTIFELTTTLKKLGAKWQSEKKKISRPDVAFILIVSSLSPVEDSKAFKLFTVANLLYQLKW